MSNKDDSLEKKLDIAQRKQATELRILALSEGLEDLLEADITKVVVEKKAPLKLPTDRKERLTPAAFEELQTYVKENYHNLSVSEQDNLLELLDEYVLDLCRKDFYSFVQKMAPLILPEGFIDGAHIKLMANQLQQVERNTAKGIKKRVQIFMPPGSMKSKMLLLFIAWCLGRHPKWNFIHVGHGTQFVEDNAGRPIRDLIQTSEYKDIFPKTTIKSDSRAAGRWDTTLGGKYYATGVGAAIAGRRAHIAVVDDALSEQSAWSVVERERINKWYGAGLRTRLLPSGSEIIVNTRYHMNDLSGYLLKSDEKSKTPWIVIKFPAILDEQGALLLNKKAGQSFWPEFWPTEDLLEKKNDPTMPPYKWNALYMQDPTPEEGNIIKFNDFKFWKEANPPEVDFVVVCFDTAFSTKQHADYSAFSCWGVFSKLEIDLKGREHSVTNLILIDAKKGRWEFPELCLKAREAYNAYKPDALLIEKKASGQSLIQELRRQGFPVLEYLPDTDKTARLHACTPFFQSGRIWVPEFKSFTKDFVDEVCSFPFAPHDDLVDTLTMCVNWLRDSYNVSNKFYDESHLADLEDRPKRKRVTTYWERLLNKEQGINT